ncbi:hypothetical protein GF319_07255 [Candidatus Bathyarchaeota archaeon]|nr:hypothetical protein [Candidatus Bathyarchaeota archaeon]
MYKEKEYREFLERRGFSSEKINMYVGAVERASEYFKKKNKELVNGTVEDFQGYVGYLIQNGSNTYDELMAVGRYLYLLDLKEPWIYYASILGGSTVYPSIEERLSQIAGKELCDKIFEAVHIPPLGSNPDKYPETTFDLMRELEEELPAEIYRKVLAGNHHRIPLENFTKYREWLEELEGDVDKWLEKMHKSAIEELEEHLRANKVWYEQVITEDIVKYVRNNQEILSGKRRGEWIYNQKFPYAPQEYLDSSDPLMKRYYMCHCPLARAAVLNEDPEIPMDWCYCSAGFGKLRYDYAFGEETEVEVLESVFSGSDRCRFRIRIPEKWRIGSDKKEQ